MTEDQTFLTHPGNPTDAVSFQKTGLKAGLMTCSVLMTYFMLMKFSGSMHSPFAWGINFIILATGIILAFRYFRSKTKLNVEYIPGLILGGITTAASVIPFVVLIYIYFSAIDPMLLTTLHDNVLFMGEPITPEKAAASMMVEGICSGVIITYVLMQYFRSGFRRKRHEVAMHG